MSEKVTVYELAYVLKVGESDAALDEVLKAHGAAVKHKSPLSQIQLAYPIKKQGVGQFGFTHLTFSDAGAVKQLSDALQLKENVLRFIIVKVPKSKPVVPGKAEKAAGTAAAASTVQVGNLDSLSNEKLSQTLEDILK